MSETGHDLLKQILAEQKAQWKGRGHYNEPKPPKLEDVPAIPENWVYASFDQLTKNFDGARVPLKKAHRDRRSGSFPYYGASGVIDDIDDYLFEGDFLLVSEDGANLLARSTPIAFQARGKFWVNNHAHIVQSRGGVPLGFIEHYFNGIDISRFVSGSAQPKLNQANLNQIPIPLPPLPEQHRIVARIEEIFSRLDAGVAALRHAKAQLQRYRQSVLAAAVTGQLTQAWREQHPDTEPAEDLLKRILKQRRDQWNGRRKYNEPIAPAVADLPEIPASWTWSSPAQLSAPEDYSLAIGPFGSNLKVSDYTDAGVPLVFVRHIRANDYELTPKFVSAEKASELKAHSVDPGDLLVTKMGEPPGDASLYPENRPHAIITADCIKLRLTHLIVSKSFFVNAINSQLVAKQIAPITRGVAQKKISLDRFRDIALPLPPLAEQHQIVAEVEARTTAIDHLEAELDRQITRAARLRQSTLAAAFSGTLS